MNRPAACLFDLDGLLLDTEPHHSRAWSQAAARFGLLLPPGQLMSLRGRRRSWILSISASEIYGYVVAFELKNTAW